MQVMDVPLSKSLASRGKKDSPNSTPSLSNADSSDQRNRESLSITTESTQSLETLHISGKKYSFGPTVSIFCTLWFVSLYCCSGSNEVNFST